MIREIRHRAYRAGELRSYWSGGFQKRVYVGYHLDPADVQRRIEKALEAGDPEIRPEDLAGVNGALRVGVLEHLYGARDMAKSFVAADDPVLGEALSQVFAKELRKAMPAEERARTEHPHRFEDGWCRVCGKLEPARDRDDDEYAGSFQQSMDLHKGDRRGSAVTTLDEAAEDLERLVRAGS